MRDLAIHGDDLIVATHGRSFWILDDITPLRQLNEQIAKSPAFLFQPQEALRWRWNRNPDTPLPRKLQREKIRRMAPLLITTSDLDAANGPGHPRNCGFHRRNRSPLFERGPAAGDGKNCGRTSDSNVLGAARENPFGRAGHAPLCVGPARRAAEIAQQEFPISFRNSRRYTGGYHWELRALPGTYTVRLMVDGKQFTPPLTLKMDPRIKTPLPDCKPKPRSRPALYPGMNQSFDALSQVAIVRAQLKSLYRKPKGSWPIRLRISTSSALALAGATASTFFGTPPSGKQPKISPPSTSTSANCWALPIPRMRPLRRRPAKFILS